MIISRIEKIIWLNVWRVISTTNLLCDLNEELVDFIRDADLRLTLYFHDTGVLLTGRVRRSWNVPKPVIPWIINAQHLGPSNKPVNINLIALNPPSTVVQYTVIKIDKFLLCFNIDIGWLPGVAAVISVLLRITASAVVTKLAGAGKMVIGHVLPTVLQRSSLGRDIKTKWLYTEILW